jgi:drug/metabolite transporter (DMT)-like permease
MPTGHVPNGRVLAAVVVLGVVCAAMAFLVFFHLIAEIGPVRATVITYINPAVAVALGVAFLGESFTAGTGFGFALVLAGSFLATRRWDGPKPGSTRRLGAAAVAAPVAEP